MTNLELAAAAWSAVRNSDDAEWNVLPMGIKAKLADLAGKYRNGARVSEGDYPPEGFAEKVRELHVTDGVTLDPDAGHTFTREDDPATFGLGRPVRAAEHEDIHIPSPNPEDVDPLKSDLSEPALLTGIGDDIGGNTPGEPPKGKLPADFPSHDLLHAAGINTYGQLIKQQESAEGLEGVTGIGPAHAAKIMEQLSE